MVLIEPVDLEELVDVTEGPTCLPMHDDAAGEHGVNSG